METRQNNHQFEDDIFKLIFVCENYCILVHISLEFVLKSAINKISALDQIMAWRKAGDKPLFEPVMA